MKAPKRPIQAVSTWVRRQPPKVKAFLAVVSGMAALVLLRAIVHDHDNLFVAAEAVHSIGIAVLIYKLMKEKTCAGMDLSILSLMLWSVFVFNLVWGKFGSLRTWNLEKMKFWALGTGHFSVEELGRKKKERKKLVFIFLKIENLFCVSFPLKLALLSINCVLCCAVQYIRFPRSRSFWGLRKLRIVIGALVGGGVLDLVSILGLWHHQEGIVSTDLFYWLSFISHFYLLLVSKDGIFMLLVRFPGKKIILRFHCTC